MTQFDSLGGMNVQFSVDVQAAIKSIDAFAAKLNELTGGIAERLKTFDGAFAAVDKAVASSVAGIERSFGAVDQRLKGLADTAPANAAKVSDAVRKMPLEDVLKKSEAAAVSFGTRFRDVAESLAAGARRVGAQFGIMQTIIAAAVAERGFEKFRELDKSLTLLQGTLGQTAAQFSTTRQQIATFASTLNEPVAEIADSVRRFAAVGFTLPDSFKLAETAAKGADAAFTEAHTATESLAQALRAFKLPAEDADRVMAQLVEAASSSAGGFAEFGAALTQVGPAAAGANFKLEETLGFLRLLANQSGSVAEATVKFRSVLQELVSIDPYSKQAEKLREVLGTTVELSLASAGPIATFRKIIEAANGSSSALREMVGDGRALVALNRIMSAGFAELDASVKKFSDVSAKNLQDRYEQAKESVTGLVRESQKLVVNSIALAFERNAEAIKGTLGALNEFIKQNKELVSQVIQGTLYFSAAVVALNGFRAAAFVVGSAFEVLAGGAKLAATAVTLLSAALTGNLAVTAAETAPKLLLLAQSMKALLFADLASGFSQAARAIRGVDGAVAGTSQLFATMGGNALTAEQRVAGLSAGIGRVALQIGAIATVGFAFYTLGRQIGEALVGAKEAGNRAYDAIVEYNNALAESVKKSGDAAEASIRLKSAFKDEQDVIRELVSLRKELNATTDPSQKEIVGGKIEEKETQLVKLREKNDSDRGAIEARINELKRLIGTGEGELAESFTNTINRALTVGDFTTEQTAVAFAGRLGAAVKKFLDELDTGKFKTHDDFNARIVALAREEAAAVTPVERITAALIKSGVSQKEAAEQANKYADELRKLNATLADFDAATAAAAAAKALGDAQKITTVAIEGATHAGTKAEKTIKDLGDTLESVGGQVAFDRKLVELAAKADKGTRDIQALNAAIEATDAALSRATTQGDKDALQKKLDSLDKQKAAIARQVQDIDAASARLRADDEARRKKEVDEAVKGIKSIEAETLRALGREVEADKAAAYAKYSERLLIVDELRKSENEKLRGLADQAEAGAKKALAAELAQIERNEKTKRDGYATARAAAQAAEDEQKRIALLQQAAEARRQADEARKRGDLRTEAALRERVSQLIKESGDRTEDLLNRERDALRTARDRLDLAKLEAESRLRAGEGAKGVGAAVSGGLRAVAGADDVGGFREAVRQKLADTQTEGAARELFSVIKQLLEAEFNALGQQAAEARHANKNEDADAIARAQQGVAEKYRVLNDELNRTLRDIRSQPGGRPADLGKPATVIPGSQVRPDEPTPPGVVVTGPKTKDAPIADVADADVARALREFAASEIKLDDAKPIRVFVTNEGGIPVKPSPVATESDTDKAETISRGDSGGGGVFKLLAESVAAAGLGSIGSAGSIIEPKPLVGPAAALKTESVESLFERHGLTPPSKQAPPTLADIRRANGLAPADTFVGPPVPRPEDAAFNEPVVGPPAELAREPSAVRPTPGRAVAPARAAAKEAFEARQAAQRDEFRAAAEKRAREEADRQDAADVRVLGPVEAAKRIAARKKRIEDRFNPLVGPPADLAGPPEPATAPAEGAQVVPDASGFVGPPADLSGIPTPPAAGKPPPAAPTGPLPAPSEAAAAAQKTFDAVAAATQSVAGGIDKLLAGIGAAGDTTLAAMKAIDGKLTAAVARLNANTKAIEAIGNGAKAAAIADRE